MTNRSEPALASLRVVEVAHALSGAYTGKLLADMGADVVKVESPAADASLRETGPFAPEGRQGGLFHYLNAGKRSVALDICQPDSRELLDRVLSGADVVVVDGTVKDIRSQGLSYAELCVRHPRLVVATITAFGFEGPLSEAAGHDITICSLGAVTCAVGDPERQPLTPPLDLSSWQAGLAAASGALLALFARAKTGRGQHVDISPLDVWATVHQGSTLTNYLGWGTITRRAGRRRQAAYPFNFLAAKDGLMCLIARDGKQWHRFLTEVVRAPELLENSRYRDRNAMGLKYPEEVDGLLEPWFAEHTREEIFDLCRAAHVPFAPVRRIDEVAACEQLASRGFFVETSVGDDDRAVRVPGAPYRLTGTPWRLGGRAPSLGQHTVDVLAESERLDVPAEELLGGGRARDLDARPLSGVRVVDLSWVLAGPVVGRLLADAGADVIKVESRVRPDNTRLGRSLPAPIGATGPAADPLNRVLMFHNLNAGKRSITIDLRSDDGVELVKALVRQSDVLIENFAPGVMQRRGLDYESLRADRPELIMLSMSGVGQAGPLSDVPAYAPTVTSLAGMESLVGYEGDVLPVGMLGLNFADATAALYGFHGLLNALWARQSSGLGQHIDLSEMEAVITMMGAPFVQHALTGDVPRPTGNTCVTPGAAPYGIFPALGEDQWISIAVVDDEEWRAFCSATPDQPWSADPALTTRDGRVREKVRVHEAIAKYTVNRTAGDLEQNLRVAGVAAARVYGVQDQVADGHFWARHLFHRMHIPGLGEQTIYGAPWRLSETPVQPLHAAPQLGEHTDQILEALLGVRPETIASLRERDVLQ